MLCNSGVFLFTFTLFPGPFSIFYQQTECSMSLEWFMCFNHFMNLRYPLLYFLSRWVFFLNFSDILHVVHSKKGLWPFINFTHFRILKPPPIYLNNGEYIFECLPIFLIWYIIGKYCDHLLTSYTTDVLFSTLNTSPRRSNFLNFIKISNATHGWKVRCSGIEDFCHHTCYDVP